MASGVSFTLFRETYHSVMSRFFSNNTCWKLIFAIHFISPTRLKKTNDKEIIPSSLAKQIRDF